MAYILPQFNITVRVRHWLGGDVWGEWEEHPAQLKGVPRSSDLATPPGMNAPFPALLLKLPARTDVRDSPTLANADQVEIPEWTGGYLYVGRVYDVAYGFPNEYRVAVLSRSNLNGSTVARPPGQGAPPS